MSSPRLLLLDSASLYFRAFYGVPDRRGERPGPPTNAVRGFLDMVATLLQRTGPTSVAACWDNDWRPAFRVEAIPSYKTHRVAGEPGPGPAEEIVPDDLAPQVPVIAAVLAAIGLPRVGVDGYEADDVIGALAHRYRGRMPVDVVTGDRDLFQLVDDAAGVRVLYTARGGVRDLDVVDESYLQQRYAVPGGPAYADLAVLRGDASDGLPGVPGIGEKTAAGLLARFGSLEGLREAVATGDPRLAGAQRARLAAAAAYLDVAPRVVRVALDAPVPDVDLSVPTSVADPAALRVLVEEHAIGSSVGRVLAALGLAG